MPPKKTAQAQKRNRDDDEQQVEIKSEADDDQEHPPQQRTGPTSDGLEDCEDAEELKDWVKTLLLQNCSLTEENKELLLEKSSWTDENRELTKKNTELELDREEKTKLQEEVNTLTGHLERSEAIRRKLQVSAICRSIFANGSPGTADILSTFYPNPYLVQMVEANPGYFSHWSSIPTHLFEGYLQYRSVQKFSEIFAAFTSLRDVQDTGCQHLSLGCEKCLILGKCGSERFVIGAIAPFNPWFCGALEALDECRRVKEEYIVEEDGEDYNILNGVFPPNLRNGVFPVKDCSIFVFYKDDETWARHPEALANFPEINSALVFDKADDPVNIIIGAAATGYMSKLRAHLPESRHPDSKSVPVVFDLDTMRVEGDRFPEAKFRFRYPRYQ